MTGSSTLGETRLTKLAPRLEDDRGNERGNDRVIFFDAGATRWQRPRTATERRELPWQSSPYVEDPIRSNHRKR